MTTTDTKKELVYVNRYIGAGGVAYSEESMARESVQRAILRESGNGIPTQAALKSYPHDNEKIEKDLLDRYRTMNKSQRDRHIQHLMGLNADSSDAWKRAPDHSEANRQSLKDAQKDKHADRMPKLNQTVAQALQQREELESKIKETFGFETDEMAEKVADLLENVSLRNKIAAMITDAPELLLAVESEEYVDRCQLLSDRIEMLEAGIESVSAENAYLKDLREAKMHQEIASLKEDILYGASLYTSRRRSLVFEEPSESNSVLMGGEDHHRVDKRMAMYEAAVARSTRNVNPTKDQVTNNLLEAFRLNQ